METKVVLSSENGSRSDNAESDDGHPEKDSEDHQASAPNVQDLRLYGNVVAKIMKESLPEGAEVSSQAQEVMRRLPTIFALFLTDRALAVTHKAKRRTLLPEDVVQALDANGFSAYSKKVIPVVEKRRSNFHKRGPRPKPAASVNPTDDQTVGEPSSEFDGESAKDHNVDEKAELKESDKNEDQNDVTTKEESSDGEAESGDEMEDDGMSGDDDEDENEKDVKDHHSSLSPRPADQSPPNGMVDEQSEEEEDGTSSSDED